MNNIRHSGIFTVPPTASVTIIGCGGLGATTALTLAKMGFKFICLFDGDVVAEENTGTQLHKPSDIGRPKAEALYDTLLDFADDAYVTPVIERVYGGTGLSGQIIISCVDSIQARKDIWEAVLASDCDWYIEMRMAAEELQIHTVKMSEIEWYDEYISKQNDKDIADVPCTMKSTFYTAMVAGGLAGSIVRKILTDVKVCHKLTFNMLASVFMEF
jgi:molybdopterin/thiamine biosynthesis adenylyltransferase